MKTVFIRARQGTANEKATSIKAAASGSNTNRFQIELSTLRQIPGTPFAYWISDNVRRLFSEFDPFESGDRIVRQGGVTGDDFRFVRCAWEVLSRSKSRGLRWVPFAKGGSAGRWYSNYPVVVAWDDKRSTFWGYIGLKHRPTIRPSSVEHYFRPGLTWPLRAARFAPVPMPEGTIFSIRGYAIIAPKQDLLAICAVGQSTVFDYIFKVALGRLEFPEFVVGTLQRLPFPSLSGKDIKQLSDYARRGWQFNRRAYSRLEETHSFLLPGLLEDGKMSLSQRRLICLNRDAEIEAELRKVKYSVDEQCSLLFGLSNEDLESITKGEVDSCIPQCQRAGDERRQNPSGDADDFDDENGGETFGSDVEVEQMVASLLSWALGVAFGRFDVRLATGERPAPPEPEPFDPLPVCSPGMLIGDDGLPLSQPPAGYPLTFPADGLLVDDPGHPQDLISAVRSVFEVVFDDADARWKEAADLLGTTDLRSWFASEFFAPHIKRYSKSRRKAPIYWQFATPSGSYSIWLYIHRATADSLFRVLDLVSQKLRHEEGKHAALLQEAGPSPSPSQRRELEHQDRYLSELRGLKAEVARVAPLWRPDLDDGVLLNLAPLWRLVPQLSSWQTECRNAWDKLINEHYDWAHLAMHLWPERVVPKCQIDRSLAIAHGLEATFWFEDQNGTWRQREVAEATIQQLIAERSSATVKAALADLRAAPAPVGRSTRRSTRAPRRTTPRQPAQPAGPDPALLNQVQAAIAAVPDGASRADVLAATGINAAQWTAAIRALLAAGSVSQTGERRGARYQISVGGTP